MRHEAMNKAEDAPAQVVKASCPGECHTVTRPTAVFRDAASTPAVAGVDARLPCDDDIEEILRYVYALLGFNAACYCRTVVASRVQSRFAAVGVDSFSAYRRVLEGSTDELALLMRVLTIKYSSFFRDPLAFAYLHEMLFPAMLAANSAQPKHSLRIWSAGCAYGEEPYSIAMLLHQLTGGKCSSPAETMIVATDIDAHALAHAREAQYYLADIADVRYSLVERYFTRHGDTVHLLPMITGMVAFSLHDLLDYRTIAPAESVFGSFDFILCRNVLMYFEPETQAHIRHNLIRALAPGGYLLLGRTESVHEHERSLLQRVTDCCSLYCKFA